MDVVKVSPLHVFGPLFINDQMLTVGATFCVVSVRLCGKLVVDNVIHHSSHSVHCLARWLAQCLARWVARCLDRCR